MLEVVEGGICLPEVLEVPEVMFSVPFGMLEAVEGRLCLPEVLEVMRCMPLCMLEVVEGDLCMLGDAEGDGGDVLCTAFYGGCRRWAQFRGFRSIATNAKPITSSSFTDMHNTSYDVAAVRFNVLKIEIFIVVLK